MFLMDYRFGRRLLSARITNPITTSQNPIALSPSDGTKKAINPNTATTTAIQKVATLGALRFIFISFLDQVKMISSFTTARELKKH
jgi:hypothetical protein